MQPYIHATCKHTTTCCKIRHVATTKGLFWLQQWLPKQTHFYASLHCIHCLQFCAFRLLQHNEKISANAQTCVLREVFSQCVMFGVQCVACCLWARIIQFASLCNDNESATATTTPTKLNLNRIYKDLYAGVHVCVCMWQRLGGVVNFYGVASLHSRFILHRYNGQKLGLYIYIYKQVLTHTSIYNVCVSVCVNALCAHTQMPAHEPYIYIYVSNLSLC